MRALINPFRVVLVCLLLAAASFAQSGGEYFKFKTKIGFDDESEGRVQDYLFDQNRKLLLVGKKSFQIWDVGSLTLLHSSPHEMKMNSGYGVLVISPDGRKVINLDLGPPPVWIRSDNKPRAAFVHDLMTGKQIAVLERPQLPIRAAQWSNDGETIVTRSTNWPGNAEISFWSGTNFTYRTSIIEKGYTWQHLARERDAIFVGLVNGRVTSIVSGRTNQGNVIRIYDTLTGKVLDELVAPDQRKFHVENGKTLISHDENYLVAEERGKNILVWDLRDKQVPHLPKYEIPVTDPKTVVTLAGLSDDGLYLIVDQGHNLVLHEITSGKPGPPVSEFTKVKLEAGRIFVTPDRKYVVRDYCGGASIQELETKKTLYTISSNCSTTSEENGATYETNLGFVLLDASGKLLLDFQDKDKLLKKENVLRIRNLRTGEVLQTLSLSKKEMADQARVPSWFYGNWSFKGDYLYSRSENGRAFLVWEVKAGGVS